MVEVDYIIVGQGLAGTALAQRFTKQSLSFRVIDQLDPHQASRVASGIWNPIVLKRMKKVWQADAMLAELIPFYTQAEELFSARIIDDVKVNRVFADEKEIDTWLEHCDDPQFEDLLSAKIRHTSTAEIDVRSGLARVVQSGRINTEIWLDEARRWLVENDLLISEEFSHYQLNVVSEGVEYGGLKASAIVFCEGMHAAVRNPYFNYLPFALTKGEVLIIRSETLKLDEIINSSVFVLPLGDDLYKIGATYAWDDLSAEITQQARAQLLEKARRIIKAPFDVVAQRTGIRPTIKDRKPLLGTHPKHNNLHIFNGMGSRGVLMVPFLSKCFIENLSGQNSIPPEADVKRFEKLRA